MAELDGAGGPRRAGTSRLAQRRSCDENRLEDLLERTDPIMAWLGVIFALVVLFDIAVPLDPEMSRALDITAWVIWVVFLIEFAGHLWIAKRPSTFIKRHWPQAISLALPTLRLFRFLRLAMAGRALPAARAIGSSYRAAGSSRALLRSRIAYLGATSVVVIILVAELGFIAERSASEPVFDGFLDALLWSSAVVMALQGDPVPSDYWARLVMLGGFAWGLIILGTVAGALGTFFVDRDSERKAQRGSAIPDSAIPDSALPDSPDARPAP
jgi:voltage-gated potassium channel